MKTIVKISIIIFMIISWLFVQGQNASDLSDIKVKNIIVMIPDGTSFPTVTLSRWIKKGRASVNGPGLNVDPYICGLVKSYNSDSPIGDSAPTSTAYATGQLSQTGFISVYPPINIKSDLIKVDPKLSWHPLMTILEASKLQGKRTGLVVTCQFPHATPADFSAHTPWRSDYNGIAQQMVHNKLNVVFGGGDQYLNPLKRKDHLDLISILKQRNYKYITNANALKGIGSSDSLVWGCFAPNDLPYVLDTHTDTIPSLSEMTSKAIEVLSKGENGFFLMVEGSKTDWAAHGNDAASMVKEFLAFDDAVKVALDFAKKDGNTAVIVCPDHGNSGVSIGNARSNHGYDRMNLDSLLTPVTRIKMSTYGFADAIGRCNNNAEVKDLFIENAGFTPASNEILKLKTIKDRDSLAEACAEVINKRTYIGFTTTGHTGEDVFLAVYHPANYRPQGVVQNMSINQYMQEIMALPSLKHLTESQFVIDTVALAGLRWEYFTETRTIIGKTPAETISEKLIRIYPDKKSRSNAVIRPNTDYITFYERGKEISRMPLPGLIVFVDNKDTKSPFMHFFMPGNIKDFIKPY